jgi:hypothetical protein
MADYNKIGQHEDQENSFSTEDVKYINENITTLAELQILSDLAAQLQNASATSSTKKDITKILKNSKTLYIIGLTENLNDSEKYEAAHLLANIITKNPHIEKLFLENNEFPNGDLSKIVSAVLQAKASPLMDSQLRELHIRNLLPEKGIEELAKKIHKLESRYAMKIDLNPQERILIQKLISDSKTNNNAFFKNDSAAPTTPAEKIPQKKHKP